MANTPEIFVKNSVFVDSTILVFSKEKK